MMRKTRVANGILRKPSRVQKLRPATMRANRLFSSMRCQIETVFAWWKRSTDYRRVRYLGQAANRLELGSKALLELETAGHGERRMKCHAANLRRRAKTTEGKTSELGDFQPFRPFSR